MSQAILYKLKEHLKKQGTADLMQYFGFRSTSTFSNWLRRGVPQSKLKSLELFFGVKGIKNESIKKRGKWN